MNLNSKVETIKAVIRGYFSIELMKLPNQKYCIHWETQGESFTTKDISDLNIAMNYFDDMLIMIEGN